MEATIFAFMLRGLDEQKEAIRHHLATGGAKTYEDYCRSVGEYTALQRMYDDVKDLEKRFIAD
jgi:hypothetical protein